jgi:hypothetical protein
MRRDSYVYGHYDNQGNVFYIGNGIGDRAFAKSTRDRHATWFYYVNKYLKGQYEVKIIKDNLTNEEAEELEAELILKYSKQLINWTRPIIAKVAFSPFEENKITTIKDDSGIEDWESFNKYTKLRLDNRKFIVETKPFEKINIEEAISRYRKAIKTISEYCYYSQTESMKDCLKKTVCLDMEKAEGIKGEIEAIERLTLCLCKVGRREEAKREALDYFSTFSQDYTYKGYVDIMKRVYKGEVLPLDVLNTIKKRDEWLENLSKDLKLVEIKDS